MKVLIKGFIILTIITSMIATGALIFIVAPKIADAIGGTRTISDIVVDTGVGIKHIIKRIQETE